MSHQIYGYHPVKTALDLAPYQIKKLYLLESRQDKRIQEILTLAQTLKIPVEFLSHHALDKKLSDIPIANEVFSVGTNRPEYFDFSARRQGVSNRSVHELHDCCERRHQQSRKSKDEGYKLHQGVAADVTEIKMQDETFLKKLLSKKNHSILLLILDGIQDPQNLGACLRSANALGAQAVIITKHHSAKLNETVQKVSCGALWVTPLIQVNNLVQTLACLKKEGLWLVGTDMHAEKTIAEIDLKGNIALILGYEGEGLRHLTKQTCDFLARIPMQGTVESLNVSASAAICLYEAMRQRKNN